MMRAAAATVSLAVSVALIVATSACDQGGSESPKTHYGDCEISTLRGVSPVTHDGGRPHGQNDPARTRLVERRHAGLHQERLRVLHGRQHRVPVRTRPGEGGERSLPGGRVRKDQGLRPGLAQITITPERSKVAEFSPPYLSSTLGVLIRDGEKINEDNIRDVRIGVAEGTTGQEFVEKRLKPTKPVTSFPNDPDMVTALEEGRIDAVVHDTTILLAYPQKREGKVRLVGQYKTDQGYGALYPKGSVNKDELDRIIRQLIDDGTLTKLSAVYLGSAFGQDPAKIPYFTVNDGS